MRSLESCMKQVDRQKLRRGDLIEINYLAALAGTTWQEAQEFVRRLRSIH